MLHLIRGTKLDFMKLAKPAFVASWPLIVIGIGYGVFIRGQDVLRRGFPGRRHASTLQLRADSRSSMWRRSARAAGKSRHQATPRIQYQTDLATGHARPCASTSPLGHRRTRSSADAAEKFPAAPSSRQSAWTTSAPPSARKSRSRPSSPSLLSLFGILIYVAIRYEFSFAVGAVLAIIHDMLMTIGWYFLSGREFNATTVAAILTIIGFSINDTIVIFDRIREDLKLGIRGTFREVMNQALNQTLSRTIITSGTVFLATLSLYHLRRRRDQRLRLHLPGRHHHRHLLQHLHRQRAGPLVAQGPAAAHRRGVAGGSVADSVRQRPGRSSCLRGRHARRWLKSPRWHWVRFHRRACWSSWRSTWASFTASAHVVKFKEALALDRRLVLPGDALRPRRSSPCAGEQGGPRIRHRLPHRAVALDGQRLRHRPHLRLFPRPAGTTSIGCCSGASSARWSCAA